MKIQPKHIVAILAILVLGFLGYQRAQTAKVKGTILSNASADIKNHVKLKEEIGTIKTIQVSDFSIQLIEGTGSINMRVDGEKRTKDLDVKLKRTTSETKWDIVDY